MLILYPSHTHIKWAESQGQAMDLEQIDDTFHIPENFAIEENQISFDFFYGRTKMSYILIHMQSWKNEINSTLNDGKHLILQHIVISIHYYNSNFRALSSA